MTEQEWLYIFGRKLEKLMNERGMTQKELARAALLGQSAISNYINGRRIPTPKAIINFSYIFGVTIESLIYYGKEIL